MTENSVPSKITQLQTKITIFTSIAWIFIFVGIGAAYIGLSKLFNESGDKFSWINLAALGSYFQGAVASVWSLAGLLFIYVAFLAQKQQLLQQESEMEDQKKQFTVQQNSIKRQNFENSLFQLLNMHNQNVSQMRRLKQNNTTKEMYVLEEGRACFVGWYKLVGQYYFNSHFGPEQHGNITNVVSFYLQRYRDHESQWAHYFRTLYHIFKFIDESEIADKRRYTSLVRAQLSAAELAFLFYNGLSPLGSKFKPLIEKYGLLEHLDPAVLLHESHASFFSDVAWK